MGEPPDKPSDRSCRNGDKIIALTSEEEECSRLESNPSPQPAPATAEPEGKIFNIMHGIVSRQPATKRKCSRELESYYFDETFNFNDQGFMADLTLAELKMSFFWALVQAFPDCFALETPSSNNVTGQMKMLNRQLLVCRDGDSGLFGTCGRDGAYRPGQIVNKIDNLVPFMTKDSLVHLAKASEILREMVSLQGEELNTDSTSYWSHLYHFHMLQGKATLFTRPARK